MRPEIKEVVDKTVQEEITQEQKKKKKKKSWLLKFLFGSSTFTIGLFVCIGFLLLIVLGQGIGKKEEEAPATIPSNGMTVCRPGGKTVAPEELQPHLGGVFTGKAQAFLNAGTQNQIDPVLLAAIARLETGNGTSNAVKNYNNPGGLMDPSSSQMKGFMKFATLDEGINAMARNLYKNYIGMGITTIEAIGAKYAPPGAANDPHGTNGLWPVLVKKFVAQMGGLTFNCEAGKPGGVVDTGSASSQGFIRPIAQTTITSPFGPRWGTIHKGIDYSCQDGVTAIAASKGGVVELAEFGAGGSGFGGYGNVVVINHGNGYWSLYGHMSSITVQKGQNIGVGQQVGVCGRTGQVTGPHLHFEIKTAFKFGQVDPAPYLPK
ncbi:MULTISPECIES: peptidoglycan DD-metalloendopeptidase family protein [Bacillus]|uniref:peptidoglycan DD-metalloendopeptidase family protein n=1 Tax=Bacillus TaxID=1386 RepID=UPI0022E03039|nr:MULTISPECIES: peptidoglycan DD-metalloendopeptidase family protein [unclassified Bacillus cereus group]MDA2666998.1 peptidoglycan DD-metalloendopeptidase family protein [Bacillus cereus group sp. Bc032]MDA2677702.1 peptidoglycan DD-metalloendopeptidase family protein [Bacillus cereus group sp. Bc031]MDA2683207.1 peptidoglycan DD-metalloendopeptidase family protein [Bacillus cereus group sp. Bc029]MDA2688645.1 peptidoglycan DD-metalloendopeptidase family protein [Bacillus cereus group sp. Bc0